MTVTLIFTGAILIAVMFATYRGHSVSLALRFGPKNRGKR